MAADIGVDYLVVGGGPAGLQLGYFLGRAGRGHLVVEAGSGAGTFYTRFPRHRRMISINKPHTGWDDPELRLRMDWNSLISDDPALRFTRYTDRYFPDASDYVRYLRDFAALPEINVRYDARVTRISRTSGGFGVDIADGTAYLAKRVIVATGFGAPYVAPIPGIELAETYSEMSVDPDDFTDQRVLIIGKGNSGFETADNLTERAAVIHVAGPSELRFAWRTHFIGNLRAVNTNFLDTYQLKAQNMVLDADILGLEERGDGAYDVTMRYKRRDKTVTLTYDRVLACTGFRIDDSIFAPDTRPELTIRDRLPALTAEWESVNVPGLYFAGTLTQSRDFRKYTSAFIHGFRYGVRALQRILDTKDAGTPWPHRTLPAGPDAMADAVLARINRTAALWDQFSFLCDLLVIDGDTVRYCEELPLDYVRDVRTDDTYVTVSLEYGTGHDSIDPFDLEAGRAWEADPANDDRYLHPVVRFHRRGGPPAVLKLPEELRNDWSGEAEFREPLRAFLAEQLKEEA